MSIPKGLSWSQQLIALRDLTARFGTLHEAQVLQLKLWPHLVDDKLSNSLAEVDFGTKRVLFTWTTENVPLTLDRKYKNRLNGLAKSVQFLLGRDWTIVVHRDSVLIYPIGNTNVTTSKRRINGKKTKRVSKKRRSR